MLNPDFLGALQQGPYGYTVVRQKQCAGECPTGDGDTSITGATFWLEFYRACCRRLATILRLYSGGELSCSSVSAPGRALAGRRINVRGDRNRRTALRDTADPVAEGRRSPNSIHELGVYSGEYAPDFIAFDKFERDCFSPTRFRSTMATGMLRWLYLTGDGQTGDESAADARHAVANPVAAIHACCAEERASVKPAPRTS
ncbi:hypothetical protein KCP77_22485 [Salmonella enterica subsp. enterica]|nr:hypothetical protein KCP77_22485 [Salmonella enterica subsp. enterica]